MVVMDIVETIEQAREWSSAVRRRGDRVGLVPTMGALHAGHFSLIDQAISACDAVAVTIFVNPLQFGPGEDLNRYPRSFDADVSACRGRGVGMVFCPAPDEMYPRPPVVRVTAGPLADGLCGATRPGHFDGVCTVVTKLFQIIHPRRAYFGEKDYQQLVIIRRMVSDLNMPIEIVGCPTVRESDGLAISSRNRYLSQPVRRQAGSIYRVLQEARAAILDGQRDARTIAAQVRHGLIEGGAQYVEYVAVVDPESLKPVTRIDGLVRLCVAARFGEARLIDNMAVDAPHVDR